VIFERLMKRVGFEAMEPFFPDEHRRFLVHIRKEIERQKRKKNVVKQHTSHDFEDALGEGEQEGDEMHEEEEEEEDDNMMETDHGGSAMLDGDDENLDMMDGGNLQAEVARAAVQVGRKGKRGRDEEDEDEEEEAREFTVNDEGKIVIEDDKKEEKEEGDEEEEEVEEESRPTAKRQRRERDQGRYKQSGAIFKAKKAGGDVKRGAIDPYAYLPLDARLGNKKKKAQASKALKAVVQGSKQGAKAARRKGRSGHKRR
jgi:ribosomal RNA-processing protein 12